MPEATPDLNNLPAACKHDVWTARQAPDMQTIAITNGVNHTTNQHLGSRVLPCYRSHVPATNFIHVSKVRAMHEIRS